MAAGHNRLREHGVKLGRSNSARRRVARQGDLCAGGDEGALGTLRLHHALRERQRQRVNRARSRFRDVCEHVFQVLRESRHVYAAVGGIEIREDIKGRDGAALAPELFAERDERFHAGDACAIERQRPAAIAARRAGCGVAIRLR